MSTSRVPSRVRGAVTRFALATVAGGVVLATAATTVAAADTYPRRFGNAQNTTDVGDDPALTPETVVDLVAARNFAIGGNGTPIVGHGLLFYGSTGIYVFDLETNRTLIHRETADLWTIESTGTLAIVTVPDGQGGTREENRFYIGSASATDTLHCLNVDAILADKATLENDDGSAYVCAGPERPFEVGPETGILTAAKRVGELGEPRPTWPLSLEPPPPGVGPGLGMMLQAFQGTPLFSRDQPIRVGTTTEIHDVLFTPSMGYEPHCSKGVVWAIDAYTGEKLWKFDPVPSHVGGVVWFSPAISKDKRHLYLTTGNCTDWPMLGEMAESTISVDPATGEVQWYRQARLVDTRDYDVGNSPTVVDVEGEDGCNVVVNVDKDGCIYGFQQDVDIPEVGDPDYDSARVGQQRLLWRQCLVMSGVGGGFCCSGASAHDRWILAQSSQTAPGDNAYGFALDACTGEVKAASSDLHGGINDGAVASGMWFVNSKNSGEVQVLRAEPPFDHLATIDLPNASAGGGGIAVAEGKLYVPAAGVVVVELAPGSGVSRPKAGPPLDFDGPYTESLGTHDELNYGPFWPVSDTIGKPPHVPYPPGNE